MLGGGGHRATASGPQLAREFGARLRRRCLGVAVRRAFASPLPPPRPTAFASRRKRPARSPGSWRSSAATASTRQANLDIQVVELASHRGRQDRARQRLGRPHRLGLAVGRARTRARRQSRLLSYSSTLGAVMAPANSAIAGIADLKGKKLAIAGGPLDKSWLMLQAVARRGGLDLKTQANIVYGAPPLAVARRPCRARTTATLTFWNFCAELEGQGLQARDRHGGRSRSGSAPSGPVAMLGYAFDGDWAAKNNVGGRPFPRSRRQGQGHPRPSPDEWQRLAPRIGVTDKAGARNLSPALQRRHSAPPDRGRGADARALYRVLAEIGGADLVGPARELDKGTFYDPGKAE